MPIEKGPENYPMESGVGRSRGGRVGVVTVAICYGEDHF